MKSAHENKMATGGIVTPPKEPYLFGQNSSETWYQCASCKSNLPECAFYDNTCLKCGYVHTKKDKK